MKIKDIRSWSAEKISQRIFYVLIALSVLVFGLFFLIGYDMPFDENPDFNAPLFTDVLIGLMWTFLLIAVVVAVVAVVKANRYAGKEAERSNGIPAGRIFRSTWLGTLLLLVLTFVCGSSAPMLINGETYGDWFWIKASDMFVLTSIALLAAGVAAVLYGATKYIRKEKKP